MSLLNFINTLQSELKIEREKPIVCMKTYNRPAYLCKLVCYLGCYEVPVFVASVEACTTVSDQIAFFWQ
jgi:hypothetical protein